MPSQAFLKARKRGNLGLAIVKERIEKHGGKVTVIPDGYFADYDLIVKQKNYEYAAEVKTDYRFAETNNIALEAEAMNHSKTDIWFYCLDPKGKKEVHLIDLKKAKEIAPRFRSGNYGEHSEKIFLVPYSVFKSQISLGQI